MGLRPFTIATAKFDVSIFKEISAGMQTLKLWMTVVYVKVVGSFFTFSDLKGVCSSLVLTYKAHSFTHNVISIT